METEISLIRARLLSQPSFLFSFRPPPNYITLYNPPVNTERTHKGCIYQNFGISRFNSKRPAVFI